MSNDAKLGLVLGVAIVVLIALVFFRTDSLVARMPSEKNKAAALHSSVPHQAHLTPRGEGE